MVTGTARAPMFAGQHGVVFFGPRTDPRRQRWWADRGLIHLEDASDNSYNTYTVKQFLERLKGLNDMLGNSREELKAGMMGAEEIDRHQRFIEKSVELAEKAKIQGMPSDASARRDLVRRRPVSVMVPEMKHQF